MDQARPDSDAGVIICRCEAITAGAIRGAIRRSDARTINALKKLTRAGMGRCQGRTCAALLQRILAAEAGVPPGAAPYQARPPVRPVPLALLAAAADHFEKPAGAVNAAVLWGLAEGGATLPVEDVDERE